MRTDQISKAVAIALVASGLLHLLLWLGSGQEWEGPVSLRKPALFGVSTGVTVWSLGWVMQYLPARPWERCTSRWISVALLAEVALITLQYWRGVASHFNESTTLDSLIEVSMLGLILLATVWIGWLSVRVQNALAVAPVMQLAIRHGMAWLLLSCLLGIGITILGKWNLMHGRPYELWGRAGVLKFPHGIALHAIQFLPLAAWTLGRYQVRNPDRILAGLSGAQLCLLLFALWQTLQGRGRTDVDAVGLSLLIAAVAWLSLSIVQSRKNHSPTRERGAAPLDHERRV